MKSAMALVAGAAVANAVFIKTNWVYDVVTVTVTADSPDFVQAAKPTADSAPETVAASVSPLPIQAAISDDSTSVASVSATASVSAPQVINTPVSEPVVEAPKSETQAPAPETQAPAPETQAPAPETQAPAPAAAPSSASRVETETIAPTGNYQKTAVEYHNAYRKDHNAGDLEWDDELARYAANTANGCVFEHDMHQGAGGYGQNLASWGSTADLGSEDNAVAKAIANQWYEEVKNYNFYGLSDPPPGADFASFGHYSQLVWKDSNKVGCASVKCPAGTVLGYPSYYTVCNYSPPGNFKGKYAANVKPSIGLKINLATP